MTTTFSLHSRDCLQAALEAVECGLDTQLGRESLMCARNFLNRAIGAMQEGSVAEKTVAGHLLDMMRDLTAQALASV